jgi:predicted MFS family arabinose efflux permease
MTATEVNQIAQARTPYRRNWSLALLFTVGALNLFDRQIINVLAQSIKTDLRISDAELGMLTGTAFGVFYSILGIPLGRLADRADRVRMIAAILVIWSGFTSACGLAGSYLHLFLMRIGVGVGEAGSQPASTALVADLFPVSRRTSAMSLMFVGAPVGSFLGLLVGGLVGSRWGWRAAFFVAGIPGLILAAVMLNTMRDPQPPIAGLRTYSALSTRPSLGATVMMLARRPGYLWLVLGNVCSAFLVYASGAWLPAFFIRVHGMSTSQIGVFAAITVGLGGAIGTFGAGMICDLLRPRVREIESNALMTMLGLSVPTLLLTVLSPDRSVALASMFLFNVCAYAFLGPFVTLTQRAATPDTRALGIAFTVSVGNILSLAVGLPLIGAISDKLTPSYGQEAIRYALALCALAGLIGALAHWRARTALRMAHT